MALLNFDNFDAFGPLIQDYGYFQNATLNAGTGIGGSTSLRTTAAMADDLQNGVYEGFASKSRTGVKGVWVKPTVAGSGDSALIEVWQGDAFLRVRPSGNNLVVWSVNSGTLFTASSVISSAAFYRIEVKWTVSSLDTGNQLNYDGSVELRVNGVAVGSANSIRLGFALPAGFIRDVFWNVVVFNPHGDGDKHYLCDGSGLNRDFLPANVNIYTAKPLAVNGTFTELTPKSGTNQGAMVDDDASDDDATYLSSAVAAKKSSFHFQDFGSIGEQRVHGLKHSAYGAKTEPGFRRFRPLWYRNGVQQFASVDYAVGTGFFCWMQHVWELDPHTGKRMTVADINASEFGTLIG
jgi:hypothetical protein